MKNFIMNRNRERNVLEFPDAIFRSELEERLKEEKHCILKAKQLNSGSATDQLCHVREGF